jgi:hypothetical protein
VCISISVDTLHTMVGDRYRDILYLNFIKMSFSISENFNTINLKLLDSVYSCFKSVNVGKGEIVYNIGHLTTSKLIIIIEGNLKNVKYSLKNIVKDKRDYCEERYYIV